MCRLVPVPTRRPYVRAACTESSGCPMDPTVLEDHLAVMVEPTGVPTYDFDFGPHFRCRHPVRLDRRLPCVLRVGARADYEGTFAACRDAGLDVVNTPQQHALASELACWYPILRDITPRSRLLDAFPPPADVEAEFGWPVFLKGSRQTSRHSPELSILRSPDEYVAAVAGYERDPILRWQRPVLRQFVELASVPGAVPGKVPPRFEFRTFWWFGKMVGVGRYWYQVPDYGVADLSAGLSMAAVAASRLDVPFLVVDIARTVNGAWTVIECNDAQESGYCAVPPLALWRAILDLC